MKKTAKTQKQTKKPTLFTLSTKDAKYVHGGQQVLHKPFK